MTDWHVGDLALCVVNFSPDHDHAYEGVMEGRPICGLVYSVVDVKKAQDIYGRAGIALRFAEIERPPCAGRRFAGYNADFFRKITPPEADAFDREVTELMNGERAP